MKRQNWGELSKGGEGGAAEGDGVSREGGGESVSIVSGVLGGGGAAGEGGSSGGDGGRAVSGVGGVTGGGVFIKTDTNMASRKTAVTL